MKLLPAKRLVATISEDPDGTTRIRIQNPADKNDGCYVYNVCDEDDPPLDQAYKDKWRGLFESQPSIRFVEDSSGFIPMDPDLPEKMFGNAKTGIDPWGDTPGHLMFEEAMNYETGKLFRSLKAK